MRLGPVLLDLFMSRRRRALRRPELDWLNGSSMTHAGWWPTVGDTLTVVAIESGIDHDIHRPTTTRVAAFTVAAKQNKGEWNEITGPSFFCRQLVSYTKRLARNEVPQRWKYSFHLCWPERLIDCIFISYSWPICFYDIWRWNETDSNYLNAISAFD